MLKRSSFATDCSQRFANLEVRWRRAVCTSVPPVADLLEAWLTTGSAGTHGRAEA